MKPIIYYATSLAIFILFMHHSCFCMERDDVEMTQAVQEQQPQDSPLLRLPNELYPVIASHLSWPEIQNASLTCRHLDTHFNDPSRPIAPGYCDEGPGQISSFFEETLTQLQAIHRKEKFNTNPIHLLLRENSLNEASSCRAFGAFLLQLQMKGMSGCIRLIDLSYNNLQRVPPSITHCTGLKDLVFFGNNPAAVTCSPERFPAMQKLSLSVYRNNPNLRLERWPQLQELYLDLRFFPPKPKLFQALAALTNLQRLRIEGQDDTNFRLGDLFHKRTALQSSDTEQICRLPKLTKLTLKNVNLFSSIADQLVNATQLKKLCLSQVNILSEQSFESDTGYIRYSFDRKTNRFTPEDEVTHITDPEENLASIWQTVTSLPHLAQVHFCWNKLRSIPDIPFWANLKKLCLYGNPLETLPDLTSLTNLEELNVAIHPQWVRRAPDLSFNPGLLANLPKLCCLYILARRQLTNDLPLLRQLVNLRLRLLEEQQGLQELEGQLQELNHQPRLCRESRARARIVGMILGLLEPTITRSLLARANSAIEDLTEKNEHPLVVLQQTIAIALNPQEELEVNVEPPNKKRRTIRKQGE